MTDLASDQMALFVFTEGPTEPNPDDWVCRREAAMLLGVSEKTISRLVERDQLREYAIGPHYVYWHDHVHQLARERGFR